MNRRDQEVTRLHRQALAYGDESFVARIENDRSRFLRFTRLAYEKEAAAADLMVDEDVEPTRAILHRSAATLAWRCEMHDEAKRLIFRALDGNPPGYVIGELNDLLDMVEAGIVDSVPAPVPQHEPATAP